MSSGKEYYFANEAQKEINLDGELSDWRIPVLADPRFTIPKGSARDGELKLFEEYAGGKWTGADDQTSAVQRLPMTPTMPASVLSSPMTTTKTLPTVPGMATPFS